MQAGNVEVARSVRLGAQARQSLAATLRAAAARFTLEPATVSVTPGAAATIAGGSGSAQPRLERRMGPRTEPHDGVISRRRADDWTALQA